MREKPYSLAADCAVQPHLFSCSVPTSITGNSATPSPSSRGMCSATWSLYCKSRLNHKAYTSVVIPPFPPYRGARNPADTAFLTVLKHSSAFVTL